MEVEQGARYRDFNDADRSILKEAIPDIDNPLAQFGKFMKGWAVGWQDIFQNIGQVEQDVTQRKSSMPLTEPETRWVEMDEGLVGRADFHQGYPTLYLTIANTNPDQGGVFNPADYILQPGRKDVQPLGMAPIWGDSRWAELARLVNQAYDLILEAGVILTPGLNDAVDLYEFLYGTDFLSGKKLSPEDRALSALGLMVGSGRGYRKGAEEVGRLAREATTSGAGDAVDAARRYLGQADEELLGKWSRATFESRPKSIVRHWGKHAQSFGKSVDEYTKDAVEFFQKNKDWKKVKLDDGTEGLLFRKRGQPGGYFTKDGKIVTFWYKSK